MKNLKAIVLAVGLSLFSGSIIANEVTQVASEAVAVADKVTQVADKAVTTADKALDVFGSKMVEYLTGVEGIIAQYGGDAANLALNVLRVEALGGIINTLLLLLVLSVNVHYMRKVFGENDYDSDVEAPIFAINMIMGGIITMLLVCSYSIWHWVGVVYPEMYAVHKFLF